MLRLRRSIEFAAAEENFSDQIITYRSTGDALTAHLSDGNASTSVVVLLSLSLIVNFLIFVVVCMVCYALRQFAPWRLIPGVSRIIDCLEVRRARPERVNNCSVVTPRSRGDDIDDSCDLELSDEFVLSQVVVISG